MSVRARDSGIFQPQCCKIPQASLSAILPPCSPPPHLFHPPQPSRPAPGGSQQPCQTPHCLPRHLSRSSRLPTSHQHHLSPPHHLWLPDIVRTLTATVTLALTQQQSDKMMIVPPYPCSLLYPLMVPSPVPVLSPHIPPSVVTLLSRKPSLTVDQTRTPNPQPLGQAHLSSPYFHWVNISRPVWFIFHRSDTICEGSAPMVRAPCGQRSLFICFISTWPSSICVNT